MKKALLSTLAVISVMAMFSDHKQDKTEERKQDKRVIRTEVRRVA